MIFVLGRVLCCRSAPLDEDFTVSGAQWKIRTLRTEEYYGCTGTIHVAEERFARDGSTDVKFGREISPFDFGYHCCHIVPPNKQILLCTMKTDIVF